MKKKVIGTIILAAALSLLIYNIFLKKVPSKDPVTTEPATTGTNQTMQPSNQPTNTPEPETKKSDMAIKLGDKIDTFNAANSVVYEFIELINEGNTREAYKMLNKDYVEEMGLPYEAFKQKYTFETEKAFKGESLLPSEYGVIVSGYILDYYGGEAEDIENSFMPYSFTIYETEPYTIADIGIKEIKDVQKKSNITPEVTIDIYKKVITTDGIILYATIENLGMETFELNTNMYAFTVIDGKDSYPHKLVDSLFADYELRPEELKHYKIFFPGAGRIQDIGITLRSGEVINIGGLTE